MPKQEPFYPNPTSLRIMKLLHGYFARTGKSYTLMSQKWMMERLAEFYGKRIPRSTLNYNLALLRSRGLVDSVKRHKKDPKTGQFVPQVTLYRVSSELRRWFSGLAGYFKRCGWKPTHKALAAGHVPVVGAIVTREEALAEVNRHRKRGAPALVWGST